jgi:pimeloyl-ACP methyl ester carboxylesterase
MSDVCADESWIASSGSTARPVYFSSENRTLFGWLHLPDAARPANIGMVICNPFGYEAICSHRSVRAFAHAAAAMGIPVLRFDYGGTGDSGDIDPAANQLAAWSRDAAAAVDELRRRTGVGRACLLGFRLGALVAALSAANCQSVKALIAVAPITSGRRYLRELRTIQMGAGQKVNAAGMEGAHSVEVSGFALSAATVAALNETDLSAVGLPSVPDMLVIDRSESPGARAWADGLSQGGARLEYVALPGFVRMMMTAPHLTNIPQTMINAARDWLARFTAGEPEPAVPSPEPRMRDVDSGERRFSFATEPSGAILTERPVVLPCEPRLFGILTEPPRTEACRAGVILLNAGATHHVGPNRMYVTLARRWAELGCVVLRIDLAGLGDSAVANGRPENEVYPAPAVEEVAAAVEFMRSRYGITDITLGGLCSGAYHALRAAVTKVPVTRILMVNPLNFFWRQGKTQNDLLWLGFVHNPGMYRRQVIPSRFWKKLLARQVNVSRLLKLYAQYGGELLQWIGRDLARSVHVPLPRDLGNELEEIASRGVDIALVFARGDPGIALLRHQAGSAVERLGRRCRIHTIDGADHIFSPSGPRAALESILTEELFAHAVSARNAESSAGGGHVSEERVG